MTRDCPYLLYGLVSVSPHSWFVIVMLQSFLISRSSADIRHPPSVSPMLAREHTGAPGHARSLPTSPLSRGWVTSRRSARLSTGATLARGSLGWSVCAGGGGSRVRPLACLAETRDGWRARGGRRWAVSEALWGGHRPTGSPHRHGTSATQGAARALCDGFVKFVNGLCGRVLWSVEPVDGSCGACGRIL